ncbi:uncharacterized protein LOC125946623 [Dermacentor silvarum]|uniref:uncharacterized protein LOC125946623 n=1 Tax=Dermacentor silvarum TaxID=543639 RepID=UPI002100D2F8|nr:uncharacterized protein LOC125946623 [Dermacentor silvarum]
MKREHVFHMNVLGVTLRTAHKNRILSGMRKPGINMAVTWKQLFLGFMLSYAFVTCHKSMLGPNEVKQCHYKHPPLHKNCAKHLTKVCCYINGNLLEEKCIDRSASRFLIWRRYCKRLFPPYMECVGSQSHVYCECFDPVDGLARLG